jgi:hypothetical protein
MAAPHTVLVSQFVTMETDKLRNVRFYPVLTWSISRKDIAYEMLKIQAAISSETLVPVYKDIYGVITP